MAVPCLQKKKKKPHTILENVLKRNSSLHHVTSTSQCDPGPSTSNMENGTFPSRSCRSSSLLSFQTSSPECSQAEICDEAPNSETRESYYDIVGCSKSNDVPLFKCDFQKRLENCITKLATKRESNPKCSVSTDDNTTSIKMNGARHKKIKTFRGEILEKTESDDNNFSMELCVVSLEEGDGNIDLISNARPEKESQVKDRNVKLPRNSSSRKQKTPKKVQYVENGQNCVAVSSTMLKRKYPCHLCSKVFGWSTDLKRHILTHTGERPFKCKLCEATFTRNFLLQKHQSKVHTSQFGKSIKSTVSSSHLPVKQDRASDVEEAECSERKSTRAKGNSVQVQLGYSEEVNWNEINLMEKADADARYNKTPYEIISHEALNIL
jgi:Zinc finger, C2H2 type.